MSLFTKKNGKAVETPRFQSPIADTHCHLDHLDVEDSGSGDWQMFENAADALARAAFAGLAFIVWVTEPFDDFTYGDDLFAPLAIMQARAKEIIERKLSEGLVLPENVRALSDEESLPHHIRITIGCHPHDAQKYTDEIEARIIRALSDSRVSAIGEIGLDYFYDFSPRDVQQEVFRRQIRLAQNYNRPIALHIRDAHDDAYRILQEEGVPRAGAVLHSFNLGLETYEKFAELGCMFSIGGPLTFANAGKDLREAMAKSNPKLLMSETDAPFLAPAPLRGVRCEPALTVFTVDRLLTILSEAGYDREEVEQTLYQNALKFYDYKANE
ncbi:MAG: TatD family hydrolase [Coriobacteriia bacterium]|nr:TatD family hydrolase [Coriobacteriia bacterium]